MRSLKLWWERRRATVRVLEALSRAETGRIQVTGNVDDLETLYEYLRARKVRCHLVEDEYNELALYVERTRRSTWQILKRILTRFHN